MNNQKIQVIREAEDKAKQVVSSAEETVNTMVRDAHNKAISLQEEVKQQAREHEKKTLTEFQHKGEEQAKKILSELGREIAHIEKSADQGEVKAVAFLKEQMKVSYGN